MSQLQKMLQKLLQQPFYMLQQALQQLPQTLITRCISTSFNQISKSEFLFLSDGAAEHCTAMVVSGREHNFNSNRFKI